MLSKVQQFSSLQGALDALFGSGTKVVQAQYTAGGDINEARRLTLNNGMPVFMKANAKKNRRATRQARNGKFPVSFPCFHYKFPPINI